MKVVFKDLPRPWTHEGCMGGQYRVILAANGEHAAHYISDPKTADLIADAVNERDDLKAENARLREALKGLVYLRPSEGENSSDCYDRLARDFDRDTGLMAPGKDMPAFGDDGSTDEERRDAWKAWTEDRWDAARTALNPPSEEESND